MGTDTNHMSKYSDNGGDMHMGEAERYKSANETASGAAEKQRDRGRSTSK